MDNVLKSLDLTTPQYAVLSQLELESGISNTKLSRRSFITLQTMHRIVSNLEKRCLIKRVNNPNHGRILSVELTEKANNALQKSHFLVRNVEANMTANLKSKDVLSLDQILGDCIDNLNQYDLTA